MDPFVVVVKGAAGAVWHLEGDSESTVDDLRNILAAKIAVEPARINFLHIGKMLSNAEATLLSYGITEQSILHVQLSRVEHGSVQSVQESSKEIQSAEREISSLMELPFVKSMFQNPETIKRMIEANPQMKKLMEDNPEFAAVMKDESTLRDMTKAMSNPSLRRELVRNKDRALANIETLPGGWNALQRMYHTIQQPLFDATESQGDSTATNPTTPDGPVLPWASNSPSSSPSQPWNQNPLMRLGANSARPPPFSMFAPSPLSSPTPLSTVPTPAPTITDFSAQLSELEDMGFTDVEANRRALQQAQGDLDAAITLLFPDPNQ